MLIYYFFCYVIAFGIVKSHIDLVASVVVFCGPFCNANIMQTRLAIDAIVGLFGLVASVVVFCSPFCVTIID